jgi:hypothetical protein
LEARSQQLVSNCTGLTDQLDAAHYGMHQTQQLRHLSEVDVARLQQVERDQRIRLHPRADPRVSRGAEIGEQVTRLPMVKLRGGAV